MIHAAAVCNPVSLSAAFMVGMAGSLHCVAMCGGISGALGLRAKRAKSTGRPTNLAVVHQVGRLISYSVAGASVGAFSHQLQRFIDINAVAVITRLLAGAVLVAIATNLLFRWNSLAVLERLGAGFWRRLAPLASRVSSRTTAGSLLLGMLWGWLPCGFVYSVLIFAALQGGALQGAALMLSFGLGTLPALLGAGILGSAFGSAVHLSRAAGWVLLVCGAVTILGPFAAVGHVHH